MKQRIRKSSDINKRYIISCTVENKPGVLSHVAGLFSSRGFNIDSLTVSETEDPAHSRMTIVTHGDEATLEQIRKQLGKIISVIKVQDFTLEDYIERNLMLVKVHAPPAKRSEIFQIADVFRARIVDMGLKSLTIEVAGPSAKLEAILNLLRPYGLKEVIRSGRIAMTRSFTAVQNALAQKTQGTKQK